MQVWERFGFRLTILIYLFTVCAGCGCGIESESEKIKTGNTAGHASAAHLIDFKVDLLKYYNEAKSNPDSSVLIAHDPFFKREKHYRAFHLNAIIDSIKKVKKIDPSDTYLVFECTDGYEPIMEMAYLDTGPNGYLAFKDLNVKDPKNWDDSVEQKIEPFYLVWTQVPENDLDYPWPFGVTAIRIVSKEILLKSIYPIDHPETEEGFHLFRKTCMKCHSINSIGGHLGPEFNIPKNITEYRSGQFIVDFAKNPSGYRLNSKMSPITNISDNEFEAIVSYLTHMKEQKINN